MTLKEFAERLNGTEYNGYPIFSKEDIGIAKENGFVIVTGASDDLMEFDGAIYSEGDCFDGGKVYFSKNGVEEDKTQNVINALWCEAEDENGVVIPWAYETKIPHETFYVINENFLVVVKFKVFSVRLDKASKLPYLNFSRLDSLFHFVFGDNGAFLIGCVFDVKII